MAHYGPEGEKIFKQAGLHYYLNKPVSDSDLFNAILGCFHLSHESKGDETEKWSVPQYSALKGVHVLLVEDNLLNQQIASELLVQGGIKVSVAENGKRAVELVEAEHFDAVLMDLQMPVMGGLEATTEIRKLAHRQTMPIIAMTANAMKTQKQQCFDVGMNDHVSKPIDADKLLKVLLKWVKTNNIETDVKKTDVSQKNNVELSDLQLSVLNISHALSRNGDNEESLLRIIRLFVEHHSPDLLALQNARQDNNFETAGKLIHTLAGIAGFVGALDLENKAQTYNRAFHSGEREELVTLLDAVLDSLSLVLADLHTILKTKT